MSQAEALLNQSAPAQTLDSDFAALLQKEFRPKTDQARDAVESAVRTLALQALGSTSIISNDAYSAIQDIIAEIDRKLSEQVNLVLHPCRIPAVRRRLARPALSGEQHRDRRAAENTRAADL